MCNKEIRSKINWKKSFIKWLKREGLFLSFYSLCLAGDYVQSLDDLVTQYQDEPEEFINRCFDWSKTFEGDEYWREVEVQWLIQINVIERKEEKKREKRAEKRANKRNKIEDKLVETREKLATSMRHISILQSNVDKLQKRIEAKNITIKHLLKEKNYD